MRMRTRGHQTIVTKTSKTINFGAVLFIMNRDSGS